MAQEEKKKNIWYYRKEILVAIIVILVVVFLYQNSKPVDFKLIFWKLEVPLIILVFSFFVIGVLTMWIYNFSKSSEKKKEIKNLKSELIKAKDEVKKLYHQAKEKGSSKKEEDSKNNPDN